MSFFVQKLGPLPSEQTRKETKSAAGADLLKHPSKDKAQAAKSAPVRAQAQRAPQQKVVDRSPPKDEPKKKKGWFG